MSRSRPTRLLPLLVASVAVLGLAASCSSDDGPGSSPGTTECRAVDTGGGDGEATSSDTTLVGARDPEAGSGSLGAGGSAGASDGEGRSNSADDGFSRPSDTDPAADEGVTGNADTGSGGSSRGPC